MAKNRIKLWRKTGVYHCMSRTVAGTLLFDVHAKEVLRKMIWNVADFCGVEVLAYTIMSNHFHVLVRVAPLPSPEELGRKELLRRYAILYSEHAPPNYPTPQVLAAIFDEDGEDAADWEQRLRARMHDVSLFMKSLKQRFSIWYNKTHRRFGTLWSERFQSVLVENSPFALKTVAAYIDLNSVRAGLAEDPGDYRWSSYAEAMAGSAEAQQGLRSVIDAPAETAAREVLAHYRVVLFGKGGNVRRVGQPAIPAERVRQVLANGGEVSVRELIRHRVKFFTAGSILGSPEFVHSMKETLLNQPPQPPDGSPDSLPAEFPPSSPTGDVPPPNRCILHLDGGVLATLTHPKHSIAEPANPPISS